MRACKINKLLIYQYITNFTDKYVLEVLIVRCTHRQIRRNSSWMTKSSHKNRRCLARVLHYLVNRRLETDECYKIPFHLRLIFLKKKRLGPWPLKTYKNVQAFVDAKSYSLRDCIELYKRRKVMCLIPGREPNQDSSSVWGDYAH